MLDNGHSEEYFGEDRNFWWNQDYFDLLSRRWNLKSYSTLLDVGCGCCHWSKMFCRNLGRPAKIIALDNDPKWAKGDELIQEYFHNHNVGIEFIQGNAYQIPFADDSFDIVTCQTVLIHIKDPLKALLEMKRVLKKGGLLICAEPNNIAGSLVRNSMIAEESIEETLDRVKFNLIYEKGKKKIGEGDNSVGDFLPGYFVETGLKEIQVYLSDKATPLYPPYSSPGELALLKTINQWADNNEGAFDYQQALRYFKTVSEDEENIDFFHRQWEKNQVEMKLQNQEIDKRQFHTGGATIMYLVSGIK
jgi:ubiquinone/menaquinone biosynthesis C-methylase UbiE